MPTSPRTLLAINVLLYIASVTDGFDTVRHPVGSFRYGGRLVRLWPCANNGPELPATMWGFRYDPVIVPVFDSNGTIATATSKVGSKWRTEVLLAFNSVELNVLAFKTVERMFQNVQGLLPENVSILPVRKVIFRLQALLEDFPDVDVISSAMSCPEKTGCFDFYNQVDQFRLSFRSPRQERAVELEEALRFSLVHYEVHTYAKLRSSDGNLETLENLYGHADLLSATVKSPSVPRQTQELEKRLGASEHTMTRQAESVPLQLLEVRELLTDIHSNLSSQLLSVSEDSRETNIKIVALANRLNTVSDKLENITDSLENLRNKTSVQSHETSSQMDRIMQRITKVMSCTSPWHLFCPSDDCYCYLLVKSTMSWTDAENNCRRLSSHLASIHSAEEQKFLKNLVTGDTWIGLSDIVTENVFVWTDESPVNYMNWESGEPRGGTEDNCVELNGSDATWDDDSCSTTQLSICKKPL